MSFAVVLTELGAPLDTECDALATLTGLTPFDVRMRASGVLPADIVRLSSMDEAIALTQAVSARKHGALTIDARDIPSSEHAVSLRRFRLERDRLYANDDEASIRYEDIVAIVRAASSSVLVRKHVEERPGYRGSIERVEITQNEKNMASFAYIFRREGAPWILREHEARYLTLGARMRATVRENFLLTIETLRAAAPHAHYDERFALHAHDSRRVSIAAKGADRRAKNDARLDLLAHALVRWLTRGTGSVYRDPAT
jgi:hypothetical protein